MDGICERSMLREAIRSGRIALAVAGLLAAGARRHTSAVCMAKYLKLAVRILSLRTVNAGLPASQFAGELVGGEVFDRLHGSAAEWATPTGSGTCCLGSWSGTLEASRNEQLAAERYARLTVTVG